MWCGFEYRKATGTSLAILVPPIGLPAAWQAFRDGNVDLGAALYIACAFAVGAYFGRFVVDAIDPHFFKLLFGLFLMFIAVRFILSGSDEVMLVVSGLAASALSLVAYLGLYLLGRRHTTPLNLGHHIHQSHEQGHTDPDYYI